MELYLPPADSTTSVSSTLMPVVGMSSNTTVPRWRGTDLVVGAPPSSTHAAVGHVKLALPCLGTSSSLLRGSHVAPSIRPPPRSKHRLSSPPRTPDQHVSQSTRRPRRRLSPLFFFLHWFFWGEVGRVTRDEVVVVGRECVAVVCLCGARMERRVFAGRGGLCTTAPGSATSKSARLPVRAGILCSSNVVSAHASIRFYTIEHNP